jgi:hypothetical protein
MKNGQGIFMACALNDSLLFFFVVMGQCLVINGYSMARTYIPTLFIWKLTQCLWLLGSLFFLIKKKKKKGGGGWGGKATHLGLLSFLNYLLLFIDWIEDRLQVGRNLSVFLGHLGTTWLRPKILS